MAERAGIQCPMMAKAYHGCRAAIVLSSLLWACGDSHHEHEAEGPTGALCPPTQSLSYDNFGSAFVGEYCRACHVPELVGDARHGAPPGVDFDAVEGIREHAGECDEHAGAGPQGVNSAMPPAGWPQPSDEERRQFAEWLACGAP